MSPVQAEVLPLLPHIAEPYSAEPPADGTPRPPRDLLVKARTGTGKTLAFLVPAVEARLKAISAFGRAAVRDAGLTADKTLQARAERVFAREHVGTLIISPTRELATQIANEALRLTHHHKGFEVRLFVGGASKRMQMRDWMKGRRDIVVATPGRLRDLLTSEPEIVRGLSKTQLFILDEADTLLDMGFRDDIDAIAEYLPKTPERQTFLFSATVARNIQQIARATLDKNHAFINTVLSTDSPVHAHVPQYHTVLPAAEEQLPHTLRLLAHDQLTHPGRSKAIVFLPTTKMTQLFATFLRELARSVLPSGARTKVYEIHSKRTQESRTMTSDAFRADASGAGILVTSDVSARGVDYPGVTRVIQVGVPQSGDQYVHRVGRTGRGGAGGGRADLVLLPWEHGFVPGQLAEVPMKPVAVGELKEQVAALAAAYDADPAGAFEKSKVALRPADGRTRAQGAFVYPAPVSAKLEPAAVQRSVQALLDSADEEAVRETFAALLGYYIAKAPELRVTRQAVVQGCKDWATGACGLPVPPYVSAAFLQKLGVGSGDGRSSRRGASGGYERGDRGGRGFERGDRGGGFERGDRGRQELQGRVRSLGDAPAWARQRRE
ncbi:hypothetical protein HWV62_30171 [Athelia sp. TMB]|nr:hypothetical protein HWV62_30171 [Athelia sp. TMB]